MREAEAWVQSKGEGLKRRFVTRERRGKSPEVLVFEREMMEKLGTRVQIVLGKGKKGKVIIEYYSWEELERIVETLSKG